MASQLMMPSPYCGTLHAFDILLATWAATGRDATFMFKVMDATAASIQDKLPFRLSRTFGIVTGYNSTQKLSKIEMRLYFYCDLMRFVRLD